MNGGVARGAILISCPWVPRTLAAPLHSLGGPGSMMLQIISGRHNLTNHVLVGVTPKWFRDFIST